MSPLGLRRRIPVTSWGEYTDITRIAQIHFHFAAALTRPKEGHIGKAYDIVCRCSDGLL